MDSLFFVNDPQALYGNPGCLKMHFSINLFHANKNFVNYFIHFICIDLILPTKKEDLIKEFYVKVFLSLNYFIVQ